MYIVKTVIDGIADPLTHISKLSFKTGIFPQRMKICYHHDQVLPVFKAGDKHLYILLTGFPDFPVLKDS